MGVDLATFRARIGCFQNPTPRSVRCWSQASALLVGVILAQIWDKVMGDWQGEVVGSALDGLLPASHQTEVQTYQLNSHPQSSCCFMMSCLLVWFMIVSKLLLQAGDIEQNPGPTVREMDTDETEEQIIKLRKNDDGLLELDLSGRKMSSLPDYVFQQNDIQVLKLQQNCIKVITTDIGLLFQLKNLDISFNKLSHLPDSISSLSNLEELNISGNTIQEFPKGMENMQALKVLMYRNNALVTIPQQVFSFPTVEELDVSDNELTELSPLIGNLLSLKVLNLRWNQSLQTLHQELCQLSDLEELKLSVCDLGYLPGNIGNLKKLRILHLSCNRISSLPESVFQSLVNLEELTFCNNSIPEIPESISNLKRLKHIKVSDNQLVRLPTSIVELTELQTLDVACNSIASLPDNFEDLVKIANLNLKHNQISIVPFLKHGAFPALQEMHLTGNPIQLSESRLLSDFCKRSKATICVDHRQYVQLITDKDEWYDETMEGKLVISLSQGYEISATDIYEGVIDLSDAGLKTLPRFFDIHHPSVILLRHNRLEAFPVSGPVVGPSNLTVLDLHNNLISAIPEEIKLLSNLTNLSVSHNKLQFIPIGLYELLLLQEFDMSYNSVQQLPPTKFPNLLQLNLSYNMFQMVPEGVLQTKSLTYLNLLGNDIASLSVDIARLRNLNTLCCDIRRLQTLSHVTELKAMPWKNLEWTVTVDCTDKATPAWIKADFIARIDVGYLQVKTDTKEVTEGGFDEHLQCEVNHICNIDWFVDTLREVNLSNCSIQELPRHIFYFPKLTTLDVSNNRLSGLPSKLVCLQSIQVLNVSNCSLSVLPDSIGDFPSLTSLDIARNNLKVLPNSLSMLSKLEMLALYDCGCHQVEILSNLASLRHVEVDVAQLIFIRLSCLDKFLPARTAIGLVDISMVLIDELRGSVLEVDSCNIIKSEAHPPGKNDIQPLTCLSISYADLAFIPDVVFSSDSLKELKVSKCSLQTLPETIQHLSNLTHLDISNNNELSNLPKGLEELKMLKRLNLSNCGLGTFLEPNAKTIPHLSNLISLNISNNDLKAFSGEQTSLLLLTELNVSVNYIADILFPVSMAKLSSLQRLTMFHCGCYQMDFLSELKQLEELMVDFWQLVSIQQQTAEQLFDSLQIEVVYYDHETCQEEGIIVPSDGVALEDLRQGTITLQCCKTLHHLLLPPDNFKYNGDIIKIDLSGGKFFNDFMLNVGVINTLKELIIMNTNCDLMKEIVLPVNLTRLNMSSTDTSMFDEFHFPQVICQQYALQELHLSKCNLQCVSEGIGQLVNLTHLDLSSNCIASLPNELFNITSLEWLSLQDNKLTSLPERIGNLISLKYLDISVNRLDSVPNSFNLLHSMNKLKIFLCGCYQLDFLSKLRHLTELTVDFWQLVSIKQQTAKQLPDSIQVEVIYYLDHNMCHDILNNDEDDGALESGRIPLDKLQCGIIQRRGLSVPSPPDDFKYCGDIIKIDLSGSSFDEPILKIGFIHTLQELVVTNCNFDLNCKEIELPSNLTQVDVSGNHGQLQCIGQQSALQMLNMSSCGLCSVTVEIGQLQKLTHLDISKNKIEYLPDELCNITSLRWLSLQDNELFSLPERIGNLLSLEYLDVSCNKLDEIPYSFRKLTTISELKLLHCGCYQSKFLFELEQLKELTVDFWQLVSIQWQQGQFPDCLQIKYVYLDYKTFHKQHCIAGEDVPTVEVALDKLKHGVIQLHTVQDCHDSLCLSPPENFKSKCGDIIKMDLGGSNFENKTVSLKIGFSHTFHELTVVICNLNNTSHETELSLNLNQLNISYNKGENRRYNQDFPEYIFHQSALEELKLSECKLKSLTKQIGQLLNLSHLDLSRNNIEYLPDELCNIISLRWLSLQDNELFSLPERIGNLLSLEYLDISCNKLDGIPYSFRELSSINELKMFHCGCYLWKFLFKLKQLKELTVDFWQLVSIQWQQGQFPDCLQIKYVYLDYKTCHKQQCIDGEDIPTVVVALDELKHGFIQLQDCHDSFCLSPPENFKNKYSGDIIKMDLRGSNFENKTVSLKIGFSQTLHELTVVFCNNTSNETELSPNLNQLNIICNIGENRCFDQDFPEYIFHQSTLEELNLSECKLKSLTEQIGQLVTLTHLDLSRNNIKYLPDELCSINSLRWLSLQDNELFSLPERIGNLLSLGYLDISCNRLNTIPESFRQLSCMNELKLFHCGSYQLDFLSALRQLQDLRVDFWQLVSTERQIAEQLPSFVQIKVIYLDCKECGKIYHMDKERPDVHMPSVKIALKEFQHGVVKMQCCEDSFTLNPPDGLKYRGDIIKMDLSGSRFDEIILKLDIIDTLQELNVANCNLNLTQCQIELPGNMMYLDISCNKNRYCVSIPKSICQYSTLQRINMSNCHLNCVEEIGLLVHLTHLDLSKNSIKYLPDELCNITSLRWLSLWGNQLSSLPAMIGRLFSLEYLNVTFNRISHLPHSFRKLSSMNELKLSHCGSHQMEFLSEFRQLREMTVDFWQLVSIPISVAKKLADSLQIRAVFLDDETCRDLYHMDENSIPSVMVAAEDLQSGIVKLQCRHDLFVLSPPDDFKYNGDIIRLDLSKSRFYDDTILNIAIIHTLQELSVAFCDIDLTSYNIRLPGKLTWLDISCNMHYNHVNEFPEFICHQSALQELNVSNCKVAYVTEKIGLLVNLTHLDLSNNRIEALPDELCNITSLRWLSLQHNKLSRLPVTITNLLSLEYLDISHNRVASTSDAFKYLHHCISLKHLNLSDNSLNSIPLSICRLQHLQMLDVSVNGIKVLPESIGDLTSLVVLNVSSNHLKELPESFTKLVNLASLDLSLNDLKALPEEMFEFVKLSKFNIASNKIETLPNTICELQNLEYLSLEENNIKALPTQFGKLHKLCQFGKKQIHGNPIEQPPIEVFEQGMEGVVAYFEELNLSKAIEVPRVKALLLGEVAAGKTSLCNAIRLGKSNLTDITDRTAGIEVHPTRLQDSIQVLMHDFGGHKIYHLTHQFFFSKAALYLIVVDLEAFISSSFDAAVKYWLNVIKARLDSKPVLRIVATHIDRCEPEEIEEKAELIMKKTKQIEIAEVETLKKYLSEIDDVLNRGGKPLDWCHPLEGFDSESLKERKKSIEHLLDNRPFFPDHIDLVSCDLSLVGVKNLIEKIVTTCEDHRLFPLRILPTSWYELELAIKSLKHDGQLCYLSMADVRDVASQKANMTPERLTRALQYLHDIGEIVNFADSPNLSNFVFHKPQWLMDVFKLVYKPVDIDDDRFASIYVDHFEDMVEDFSTRGIVSKQMLQCLWKDLNLSGEEESMLISLLQKFDLCFEMPQREHADPYTIQSVPPVYRFPWLLTANAPCMPREIPSDDVVLMVVFQLQNYCPVGLFETLSVKLNKFIKYRKDWQYGIQAVSVVGKNKFDLLVQLKPKERSEEILISVQTQDKKLKEAWGVMVLIINATKELLQQWPGVLYCVRVVCPHCLKKGEDKPHRFSGAVLDKAPGGIVVCPKTWDEIDPRLIHPHTSPAQWQQRRKRALKECGKSPAHEEIMMEKQPRYSEPEPGNPERNNTTVHAMHISRDCNAQNHADTENVWERFRSMSIEMQPGDEESRLRDHLMESGLILRPDVPKDGNCLFHAVSDQLVRTGSQATSHSQLRQDVVGYLREHPHNEQGNHLRAFVPNEDWEGYLQQMSRDGVWGDHIVLQALASMLGRDIRIVSSIDADNYTTILSPMGNQQVTGPPLLLGHYAENHYASLDSDSNRTELHPPKTSQPGVGPSDIIIRAESRAKGSGINPVVLLINDEYGTSRGGVSTIHRQMAGMLVSKGAVVYSTVLGATKDDEDDAAADGVQLIFPTTSDGDNRKPRLDWLTWEHKRHYPKLPSEVGFIIGHVNITSRAARQIKEHRLPSAKLVQVTHVIPEDTSHYKGDEKAMSIGEESDSILEDLKHADVIFSVGPYMYDYYKSQTREMKPHHEFLPKPSDIFSEVQVKHVNTETKVVLSIGRVKGVEILKGYDLVARAMSMVIDHLPNAKWRVRGVSHEDFPESKKLIQAHVEKGKFNFTPLKYATQKELSEDMQKADVVLMPSRAEPFGLVALEAIAAGVPVLVSHKSGLAWFLKSQDPEFDRLIVEIADDDNEAAKTLAKRIIKVLKDGKREFQAARRLKETLLASKYWDASHSKFLEAFGL